MPQPEIITEYDGYTIKPKRDFPRGSEQEGWVVTDGGIINVMPGATWFRTTDDAIRGISALTIAKAITPEDDPNFGKIFWALMRLTKPLEGAREPKTASTPGATAHAAASAAADAQVFIRLMGVTPDGLTDRVKGPYQNVKVESGGVIRATTFAGQKLLIASYDYESDNWFTETPAGERTYWDGFDITSNGQ